MKWMRRIALVHDYLVQDGGAERVLGVLQELFPEAPTFVLLHDPDRAHKQFQGRNIKTSFLDYWFGSHQFYQWTLPLMPMAIEHFDFTGFDLVISSSSSFAKGIIVPPGTTHVCYCHTPTRFLWQDRIGYLNDLPQPKIFRTLLPPLLHRLRTWDRMAAERPDIFLTNSATSQQRIKRYYRRDSTVIHPPVDIERITASDKNDGYWLAGGRLVGYKRFDLIVRAFKKLNIPLKIFGVGPEFSKLRKLAGKNIEFVGKVSDEEKIKLYQSSIAFLHPQIEDFGITAIEAMAAGKPVMTYSVGGGAETVLAGVTGEHLETQSWESIGEAVIRFDPTKYSTQKIREHAETFSTPRFKQEMTDFLTRNSLL